MGIDGQRGAPQLHGFFSSGNQLHLDVVDSVGPQRQGHGSRISVQMTLQSAAINFPGDEVIGRLTIGRSLHGPRNFGDDQNFLVDQRDFAKFPLFKRRKKKEKLESGRVEQERGIDGSTIYLRGRRQFVLGGRSSAG